MSDTPTTLKTACAYYRTSSASGVNHGNAPPGDKKDSYERQKLAVEKYAAENGIMIVGEYYDKGVSGTVSLMSRPQFAEMYSYMMGNGARMILIETANRFARDAVIQITGHDFLRRAGVELIPVDAPGYFLEDTPTAKMIRGVLAVVSEFEKSSLVERMRVGRERKKAALGWCGGRRPVPPAHAAYARAHKQAAPELSYRQISDLLADHGFVQQRSGKPYHPGSIRYMLEERSPAQGLSAEHEGKEA